MLTLSKPLTSAQGKFYYQKDFSSAEGNYYSEGQTVRGQWQGKLAEQWGLTGAVVADEYNRLCDGQDPHSEEQLIGHHSQGASADSPTREHRAGWDATFSAPKSVSLTALVGGDSRILEAHRESVREALGELERFTQARMGGNHPPENTGKLAMATFEHDSARPVDGYPAPQLHTHAVIFNLTRTTEGQVKPLQPLELFRSQQYATAVYQSHLADKLEKLGYSIEAGTNGAPEIKGYSKEYLEANSPRSQQIKEHIERYHYERYQKREIDQYISSHPELVEARKTELAAKGSHEESKLTELATEVLRKDLEQRLPLESFEDFRKGRTFDYRASEAEIAAHRTREPKAVMSREEVHARHLEVAQKHGNQPQRIMGEAEARGPIEHSRGRGRDQSHQALTYARDRNQEREAVNDEREILRDALRRSLGVATPAKVKETFEAHLARGEFIRVAHYNQHSPARAFTTPETLALEKANIEKVVSGQGKYDPLVSEAVIRQIQKEPFEHLNANQRSAVEKIFANQDQIVALNGKAGTGKTTTLAVIREAAERQGYQVEGFAPTTRAAKLLEESGIRSRTLQKFLTAGRAEPSPTSRTPFLCPGRVEPGQYETGARVLQPAG